MDDLGFKSEAIPVRHNGISILKLSNENHPHLPCSFKFFRKLSSKKLTLVSLRLASKNASNPLFRRAAISSVGLINPPASMGGLSNPGKGGGTGYYSRLGVSTLIASSLQELSRSSYKSLEGRAAGGSSSHTQGTRTTGV